MCFNARHASWRTRTYAQLDTDIRTLLGEKTFAQFEAERPTRAAFERYIEIVSEASRHIPPHLKTRFPPIPWKDIANIGNHLRHAYDNVDAEILWNVYRYELDALEAALKDMAQWTDDGSAGQ